MSEAELALTRAATEGHTDIVEDSLKNGANINFANQHRNTALHLATFNGHSEIVQLVLSRKPNLNLPNKLGQTPLQLACMKGNRKVVDLLVRAGANVDLVTNYSGMAALHFASKGGHAGICQYLLDVGATEELPDSIEHIAEHYAANEPTEEVFRKYRAKHRKIATPKPNNPRAVAQRAAARQAELERQTQMQLGSTASINREADADRNGGRRGGRQGGSATAEVSSGEHYDSETSNSKMPSIQDSRKKEDTRAQQQQGKDGANNSETTQSAGNGGSGNSMTSPHGNKTSENEGQSSKGQLDKGSNDGHTNKGKLERGSNDGQTKKSKLKEDGNDGQTKKGKLDRGSNDGQTNKGKLDEDGNDGHTNKGKLDRGSNDGQTKKSKLDDDGNDGQTKKGKLDRGSNDGQTNKGKLDRGSNDGQTSSHVDTLHDRKESTKSPGKSDVNKDRVPGKTISNKGRNSQGQRDPGTGGTDSGSSASGNVTDKQDSESNLRGANTKEGGDVKSKQANAGHTNNQSGKLEGPEASKGTKEKVQATGGSKKSIAQMQAEEQGTSKQNLDNAKTKPKSDNQAREGTDRQEAAKGVINHKDLSKDKHGQLQFDKNTKKFTYKNQGLEKKVLKDYAFEWSEDFKKRQQLSVYDRLMGRGKKK